MTYHNERHPVFTTTPFNINVADSEGRSIAHYVAKTGSIGLIDLVNDAGADWNLEDNAGNTPTHMAAEHPDALRRVSRHGGLMSKANGSGRTALELALAVATGAP